MLILSVLNAEEILRAAMIYKSWSSALVLLLICLTNPQY